mmetsp:Transcript_23872/g.46541  ORF Transcript_23872/g.46541 Transcript_23872/m.46541 type:complete len:103 (+) Transcript_23872:1149-1457(+)
MQRYAHVARMAVLRAMINEERMCVYMCDERRRLASPSAPGGRLGFSCDAMRCFLVINATVSMQSRASRKNISLFENFASANKGAPNKSGSEWSCVFVAVERQ